MELTELNLSEEQIQGVTKIIQSESDKVRTEYSKKIKELTDDEKALQERIKALEDREKALQEKELKATVQGKLKDKGLNEQLVNYLNFKGVDDLETYINEIAKVINIQVDGYKPKGHEGKSSKVTKDDFRKMNYIERMELYNNNKALYDALSK